MTDADASKNATVLATDLTIAWLNNPNTRADPASVPHFLERMHQALTGLVSPAPARMEPDVDESAVGAVSVRKSLASADHIISMIDGKPYRTLRRHLATNGLTPTEYRVKFKLKPDYLMVAPAYSEARRALAKSIGLGRKTEAPVAPKRTLKPRFKTASPVES